jgi:hypothetical protein
MYCASFGVPFDRSAIDWLLATWWHPYNRPLRFVQPRDLIAQVVAIAQYLNREPAMEPELLDRACRNYFITDTRSGPTQARV